MTSFFESMKGYNENLMAKFTNSWKKGSFSIGAVKFEVMTQFIAEAIGLINDGRKVAEKTEVNYQTFEDKFLHDGEKLARFQNGYAQLELPLPFSFIIMFFMCYFTLEARYMMVHAYHFPILNHIYHKNRINFPFYLLSSL